ncbi:MAG: aminomethyl-transferring glycine dehydrogenase subunit GcvPA [Thermoplasmata archaeon]|nr:aminomethyl-transferring glycine dehydrogenase subunit GcvPA [Thermoplasmata archaeon]
MAQDRDTEEMLAHLKITSVNELFEDIPDTARSELIGLNNGMTEQDVRKNLENILDKNISLKEMPSFLGGGAYDYYVPAAVNNIVGRSEFITSYTPYQPEISQGLLQALFEYQSMMSELTGMEVVNNSLYDYTTGLGEAVLMAARLQRKARIFLIPDNLPVSRISVLENYCNGPGIKFQKYAIDKSTGMTNLEDLKSKIDDNTIGVLVETPNYYGVLENQVDNIRQILHGKILVVGADAVSLGIVRPPGDYGADIVISEGQVFGNAVNFGGPMLGIMACRKKHIRKMPGRVIGLTSDTEDKRAFCMTLQTREQHIRREKATSNICSNEALTTVATATYMAYMGGSGLRELAIKVMQTSRELANQIAQVSGCQAPKFSGHYFNEFVATFPINASKLVQKLNEKGINPGIELEMPGMENDLLIAVTDKTSPEDIQKFVQVLREVL